MLAALNRSGLVALKPVSAIAKTRKPQRNTCAMSEQSKYEIAVKGNPDTQILADCPFCHRALLTLEEKKVPYNKTLIDFNNKPEWLFEVNPKGTVPVIKDLKTGEWTADSAVIADMLEAKFPEPKLGTVDQAPQVGNDVFPAFIGFLKASEGEAAEKEMELVNSLKAVNDYLNNIGPYVGGTTVCATDLSLAPKLYHMKIALKHFKGWDLPADLSAVHRMLNLMMARDSWKNTYYNEDLVIAGWKRHLEAAH